MKTRRALLQGCLAALFCLHLAGTAVRASETDRPLRIGLTGEYGLKNSEAAQSIEKGIRLAIEEINAAGGVLGRKLDFIGIDDRGLPARAIDNFATLAADPDLVAVFCGRFSPVALELAPLANRHGLLLLDPWAAADSITQQPAPSYVFRLSLTDTWAINSMLDHARKRGFRRIALFVPNTSWGRSSETAVRAYLDRRPGLGHETFWYNWGDTNFAPKLLHARVNGAEALLMVANEAEGSHIVRQMAELPAEKRIPILSHWGIAGGDFARLAGDALQHVDLAVVQTFSFNGASGPKARNVATGYRKLFGTEIADLRAQVGFAHAYDLTHLLALAMRKAGRPDRAAIRDALERVDSYAGLLRTYRHPFGAGDHEALDPAQVFLGRFDVDGSIKPRREK